MEYRKLGRTDIEVSPLCIGLWNISDSNYWGEQDEKDSIDMIHGALDLGINFFDTAEAYGGGYSEVVTGKALHDRRDRAIIATKVGAGSISSGEIKTACENSLKRLQTDYIDLYQLHWPVRDRAFEDSMNEMTKLQDAGKIRMIGVSNYGVIDQQEMLKHGRFETNQLPYSLLFRAIEYGTQQIAAENGISILAYSPLQQGLLADKYKTVDEIPPHRARTRHFKDGRTDMTTHGQPGVEDEMFAALDAIRAICDELGEPMVRVALAWVIHQQALTSVIGGARNVEQVEENIKIMDLKLSDDVLARLDKATASVKEALGDNNDPWRGGDGKRTQ